MIWFSSKVGAFDVRSRARGRTLVAWAGVLLLGSTLAAQEGEWPYFGGDRTFKRYSPLDRIDASNVGDLRIVWRRPGLEPELREEFPELRPGNNLRSTPIMVDGRLFLTNLVGLLRAVDPASGEALWSQAPFEPTIEEARGLSPRGVDLWTGGERQRLFLARGNYLYSVDASSGELDGDFGDQGRVSLRLPGPLAGDFTWTAGPIVVGDVVVTAGFTGGAGDGGNKREATPEDVRGYDVRTGRRLWTFHVVPRPGEPGNETWGEGSWEYSGDLGSWCCLTADEELGYVYVQLSAPTAAYYGGHRPGDNLYSNALVALNARTGERIWHFQMVRHDVWEWDTVGPATLGEITVDGRRIDAVMQPSKTGFLYVFDRRTGEPVWPIEERAVPGSRVPGERLSPTQPFPTKPPPFDRQGFVEDDLIDFTPELRARALELVKPFRLGPIFTPPGLMDDEQGKIGTLTNPGFWGTGNWHTGAFDPETGVYYAVSHTWSSVYSLKQPEASDATLGYVMGYDAPDVPTLDGLPIVKPPYGRITAIDLHRGEHVWMAANGDGPRDHPLLEGLDVPPLGVAGRPAPLVTKTLLFIGEGSDAIPGIEGEEGRYWGRKFRAYDKSTGEVVWETELPSGTTGAPITYLHEGRQFIVVAIGGNESPAEFVAFGVHP
ncbi:MAG: PQQ-binding-like beta-propeller repeat protein [Holophagales bacterium]|nr:PQQ-binding-like beta-propeller repeat protein [Holophagales bacterium]MYG32005.1 PQQ-binding-like beta-propeller repeat protein [Holophagales bacterium]MYI80429.1 PQQ-binding-like beta-propeller repeat protein [Holophagales bacterium]